MMVRFVVTESNSDPRFMIHGANKSYGGHQPMMTMNYENYQTTWKEL